MISESLAQPEQQEQPPVVETDSLAAKPKKPRASKKTEKEAVPKKEAKSVKKPAKSAGKKSVMDEWAPVATTPVPRPEPTEKKEWYIFKVQVNREDSVRKAIQRNIAVAGMDQYFGDILIPTEKVTEIRGDKRRIISRKLYPGYLMISMEMFEEALFLVRETRGVNDFSSDGGKPSPMHSHEVEKMLASQQETPTQPKLRIGYSVGDHIKVKDGTFETCEGMVDQIDYASGRVTVVLSLFGRSTPVELEYWQIEVLT